MSFIVKSLSDEFHKPEKVLGLIEFAFILRPQIRHKENRRSIGVESSFIGLIKILLIKNGLKEKQTIS